MQKINYVRPPLVSYQTAILNTHERFTVTEASTKTGKTASHIVWLFEEALKLKRGQAVWWVAPVYGQAEIAFNRMRNQVTDSLGKNFFKINESKLKLTLPTGAVIQFRSAEKPDNLYGDDVYACVFDEFTRAREGAWFALRSTLTATRGKCKFIGNVKGKKNWGYKLGVKARGGDPEYKYFKITAHDAVREGILSADEVAQAERDLPAHVFKELYLSEASDDGSNPFDLKAIQNCIRPLSVRPVACYGIDLAKSVDWCVIIGLDDLGDIAFFDRFQKDWKQTKETIIKTVGYKPALIDSTGVGDPIVEDISKMCPKVEGFKFTSNSKQQIMEGLSMAVQQGKTSVLEGVHYDEMESFEYEYTRTGVKYSAPVGMHDDIVCAHALAIYKMNNGKYSGKYEVR